MGKNKRDKKSKPMAGPRIQQMCPAMESWKVLLLELDNDDNPVMDDGGDPTYSLVNIAFWALLVEEDESNRYQEMLPCVPTAEGTLEPVDPDDPCFIAILSPSDSMYAVEKMVEDYVTEFLKISSDEEGGDDDEE